jgi:tetratricopeptide (TPR) repeat protein
MYVGIAIALVCASITWNYSAVWADEFAFWGRVVKTVPESPLAQAQFGSALMDRGDFDGAERALIFAARHSLGAEYKAIAYNNLSLIYRRKGKLDESEQVLMQALEIAPHPGLYHSLGMTYAAKAQADQARGDPDAVKQDLESAHLAFETALSVGASSDIGVLRQWEPAKTHGMLGQVLLALGDQAAARAHFEAALRLDPYGPTAAVTRRLLEALK